MSHLKAAAVVVIPSPASTHSNEVKHASFRSSAEKPAPTNCSSENFCVLFSSPAVKPPFFSEVKEKFASTQSFAEKPPAVLSSWTLQLQSLRRSAAVTPPHLSCSSLLIIFYSAKTSLPTPFTRPGHERPVACYHGRWRVRSQNRSAVNLALMHSLTSITNEEINVRETWKHKFSEGKDDAFVVASGAAPNSPNSRAL